MATKPATMEERDESAIGLSREAGEFMRCLGRMKQRSKSYKQNGWNGSDSEEKSDRAN
jgi:hypothetical protein